MSLAKKKKKKTNAVTLALPVLFLTSGIKDVEQCNLIVNDALLAVRVLNGWVVLVDEVALDELDGQSRLADTFFKGWVSLGT